MKIIDGKTIVASLITLLTLTGVFLFNQSYAMPENVPSITSFEKSTIEDNALKVTIKSNNTGTDYSYEIINTTTGKTKNLAGSVKTYTYQGLTSGKEYEIMIKACDNKERGYSCTSWSPSKKAVAGPIGNNPTPSPSPTVKVKTPTLSKLTPSTNSVKLTYKTSGNVTGVEIKNTTLNKTYKTTNRSTFTETGLKAGKAYSYKIRAYYNDDYSSYTSVKSITTKKITNISTAWDSYSFYKPGMKKNIGAKGAQLKYSSSNKNVAAVNSKGEVTSKKAGTAYITINQSGVTKKVKVIVPKINSHNEAMKPLEQAAIAQAKHMKNYKYSWKKWRPCTIARSKYYGTCVTYVAAVMYRLDLLKDGSCKVLFCNSKGKPWHEYSDKYFTAKYFGKNGRSIKSLKQNNILKKGDVLMYAYGDNGAGTGNNHNYIFAGSYSGNKVKAWSNNFASSFKNSKNGRLETNGRAITAYVRPKTYNIYTSATNGTITGSKLVLAAQNVKISYKPNAGYKLKSVTVDGKKVSVKTYPSSYTFKKLSSKHSISVIYIKK